MRLQVLGPSRLPLGARVGETVQAVAVYARQGGRSVGCRIHPTVLVREVRDAITGILLTDHLWFNRGSVWQKAGLRPGDVIAFTARVIEYHTGYWGPNRVRQALEPARCDYRLTPPVKLRLVARTAAGHGEAA